MSSTRIKDAGIAIRHSRGRILFYTAGSGNGLEGVDNRDSDPQKDVDPKKKTLCCCTVSGVKSVIWGLSQSYDRAHRVKKK